MALTWVTPDRVGVVTGLRVSLEVAVCWEPTSHPVNTKSTRGTAAVLVEAALDN